MAACLVLAVAMLAGLTVAAHRLASQYTDNVEAIGDPFKDMDEAERPRSLTGPALTFLIVGTDSGGSARKGARKRLGRADTIMLARFAADRRQAAVVSIPRDSWVTVPGRGTAKINSAYANGGPTLLIRTVERLTDVRIDHFAVVDFAGFKSIIDALGGVPVEVSESTTDLSGVRFRRGSNHLDGTRALAYVRQRYGLPRGDLDRVRRQQNLLRAVLAKLNELDPMRDPRTTYRLLDGMTRAISVDRGLSQEKMHELALSVRDLREENIAFVTAPVRSLGMEGEESVVYLDRGRCTELWRAVRSDSVHDYLARHRSEGLPDVPR